MKDFYNELLTRRVLQFITNGESAAEIISQTGEALKGGCRWIQIRMKEFPDKEIRKVVEAVAPLCAGAQAVCIMNDRVDIAAEYGLDGVHLGRDDMSVAEARNILGEEALIGVTANTIEEIMLLSQSPMSYFGVGPMRYTDTKKNLRPFIGLEGYSGIVSSMRSLGITKPAVAIGGIRLDDTFDLLETGIWGIAVSGAIANSGDIEAATRRFIEVLNRFN